MASTGYDVFSPIPRIPRCRHPESAPSCAWCRSTGPTVPRCSPFSSTTHGPGCPARVRHSQISLAELDHVSRFVWGSSLLLPAMAEAGTRIPFQDWYFPVFAPNTEGERDGRGVGCVAVQKPGRNGGLNPTCSFGAPDACASRQQDECRGSRPDSWVSYGSSRSRRVLRCRRAPGRYVFPAFRANALTGGPCLVGVSRS